MTSVQENTREITDPHHPGSPPRSVDVDVENGQKNTDAECSAPGKVRLVHLAHVSHRAIGRAEEKSRVPRNRPCGVTKKEDGFEPEKPNNHQGQPKGPMHPGTQEAEH